MPRFFYNRGSRWFMHRSSCQQRHMSKPICLGFELTEAISFRRVKKTQIFSHRSNTHSALLLLLWAPHTWSTLPLRASPSCRLHRHCRGGFRRHCIFFFFDQPSSLFRCDVRSACTVEGPLRYHCTVEESLHLRATITNVHCTVPFSPPALPLHRNVEEVVPMPLPLALPLFNLVPLYVYFYVLGCFWIRLDLIFCIVCVFLYFQSWI